MAKGSKKAKRSNDVGSESADRRTFTYEAQELIGTIEFEQPATNEHVRNFLRAWIDSLPPEEQEAA